jgi:YD repeat-containing protein
VNGRSYTSTFTRSTQARVLTTPAGRQRTELLDLQGRVTESRVPGLAPTLFQYDTRGRLTAVSQGTRSLGIGYDSRNRPTTLTDSLLRQTQLEYDNGDRVTRQVLPGSREIQLGYDLSSNVTSVTPPGRPAHLFDYTPLDLNSTYSPPDLGGGSAVTSYGWDLDRAPTSYDRPDGRGVSFGYDGAGRVSTLTMPEVSPPTATIPHQGTLRPSPLPTSGSPSATTARSRPAPRGLGPSTAQSPAPSTRTCVSRPRR